MKDITEALYAAIDMENDGRKVYLEAAQKTGNKLGKLTLEVIAAKELDHIKAIENYAKNINLAIKTINPKEKKDYIRPIMEKLKKELEKKSAPDAELEKAYNVALGLEKASYDFYDKLAKEADDPQAKRFFQFLMGEENTHYELLSETLQYLNRTGDWYREKERWLLE